MGKLFASSYNQALYSRFRLMRMRLILFLLCPWLCFSDFPASEEESLFLRRIADFWQEGEVQLAKTQMEEFIAQFPESQYFDLLCLALGDLSLREKNYSVAMSHYVRISSPDFFNRAFLNRMQCLYHMEWYATLADECEEFLAKENLEDQEKLHATYFLAIALYQQCLNAAKEPDTLLKLANRAQPHFETLFQTELSEEVAQAFAHLCCILKDYPRASRIYLDIGQKNPEMREEMLFQAALIQAEYDKEQAIATFSNIVEMGEKRAKEAAYNKMVLAHELGLHEQLAHEKDLLLSQIPQERESMAHLFLGRSLLSLEKFSEAAAELKGYIESASPSETTHAALIHFLDASFQSNHLSFLEFGIGKLKEFYPKDPELPKALLSRAQLLKRDQKLAEARICLAELLSDFPAFAQKAQVTFEITHLDFQMNDWLSCRKSALSFLSEFPNHDLSLFAWRHLISADTEIAALNPQEKEAKLELVAHLHSLLKQESLFSSTETCDYQFLLAATHFELGDLENATKILHGLLGEKTAFSQEPNALLLLSLCYRDGLKDPLKFCQTAELALEKGANFIDAPYIHTSLFNTYLELAQSQPECIEKAAHHLYAAFEAKADIQVENLLWLAESYYSQFKEEVENDMIPQLPLVKRTATILERAVQRQGGISSEESLYLEPAICKLARLYSVLGKHKDTVALLENLLTDYQTYSSFEWSCEKEVCLILAENYLKLGEEEKASLLFDSIVSASPTIRSRTAAAASLQSARIKFAKCMKTKLGPTHPDFVKVLSQLKDLILQKSLANEPIHLEAALDYVEFQSKLNNSVDKHLKLLSKTKIDFEQTQDLLSKDYHEARVKLPRKNQIYQGYMQLIDAEILRLQARQTKKAELQKELQAKAKDLLLQIIEGQAHPSLVGRARQQLLQA